MGKSIIRKIVKPIALWGSRNVLKYLPDEMYLKLLYFYKYQESLNLSIPVTYNEKVNWLKLHDRNPFYTLLVDKYEVRKYVSEVVGEKYLIPLLGVWDSSDKIDFSGLPNQFVLKCTHDSGSVVVCKDKSTLDFQAVRKKLDEAMKYNFYYIAREWPYKDVKPRIIAEQYMEDMTGQLMDYKFFCFDGEVKLIVHFFDRFTETKSNHYTADWEYLQMTCTYPNDATRVIEPPKTFEEMKYLAKKLSKGIPHVRVDLYSIGDEVFFGELTFSHWGGMPKFVPREYNYTMGSWLKLPSKSN